MQAVQGRKGQASGVEMQGDRPSGAAGVDSNDR